MKRSKRRSFLALLLAVIMILQNTIVYAEQEIGFSSVVETQEQSEEVVEAAAQAESSVVDTKAPSKETEDGKAAEADKKAAKEEPRQQEAADKDKEAAKEDAAKADASKTDEAKKDAAKTDADQKDEAPAAEAEKSVASEVTEGEESAPEEAAEANAAEADREVSEAEQPEEAAADEAAAAEEPLVAVQEQAEEMPVTVMGANDITIGTVNVPAGMDLKIGWIYFGANSWDVKESGLGLVDLKSGNIIQDYANEPSWFSVGFPVVSTDLCVKVNNQYFKSGKCFSINGQYYQVTFTLSGNQLSADVNSYSINPGKSATVSSVLGEGMDYGILANEMTITGHFETNFATKVLNGACPVNGPITNGSGGYTYIADYTGNGFKMSNGNGNDTSSEMYIYTTKDVQARLELQQPNGAYVGGGVSLDASTYTKSDIEDYVDGMMDVVKSNSNKLFNESNQLDVTNIVGVSPDGRGYKYIDIQYLSGGKAGTYYLQFDPGEYANYANAIYNLGPDQYVVLNIPDTDVKLQEYSIYRNGQQYNPGGKSKSDGSTNGYSDYHAQTMIYNCPNALTVATAGPFDGTVIATKATYDNNSVGSGWLAVNNFNSNSSEWHLMYGGLPRTDGGSLVIQKTIAGDLSASGLTEAQKEDIKFTITGPGNYSKVIGYDSFVGGKYTLSGIAAGAYTVTESSANITGYTLNVTGDNNTSVNVAQGGTGKAAITNTYTAAYSDCKEPLKVKKVVSGTGYTANEDFSFTLSEDSSNDTSGYTMPTGLTETAKDGATATFGDITFSKAGTYYFIIKEAKGTTSGMTYDTDDKYAKVVVSENKTTMSLDAVVTYGKSRNLCNVTALTVTNTYNPPKTLQLEVKKAVTGNNYTGNEDFSFTLAEASSNNTFGYTMPSNLTKTAKDGNTATFDAITFTADGQYVFTIEESAPAPANQTVGMSYSKQTVTATVDVSGGQAKVTYAGGDGTDNNTITNTYKTTTIKIKKTDIGGTKELTGAYLNVKDSAGNVVDSWITDTSKELEHEITIAPGNGYTLTETAAPKGFEIATAFTFNVDKSGYVTGSTVSAATVSGKTSASGNLIVMEDDYQKQEVYIRKTDEAGKLLGNAHFSITKDGNSAGSFMTDNTDNVKLTLKPGTYTLTETNPPSGYAAAAAVTFTVDEKGVVTMDGKTVNGPVVIKNDRIKATVKIKKTDLKSGSELAGATLEVTDKATGDLIESWTSGQNNEKEHSLPLAAGSYTLTEKAAPFGYAIATAIDFTVNNNGTVTVNGTNLLGPNDAIVMADDLLLTDVKIKKTDISKTKVLQGATLQVKEKNSNKVVTSWTTDATGEHTLSLTEGEYILEETSAPQGYVVATAIEFTVKSDKSVEVGGTTVTGNTIVMEDDYADQTVKIKKTDIGQTKELSGATLEVTDSNGTVIDNWQTDTNVELEHSITVKPGTYTLTEKAAPQGFDIATAFNFTVDEKGVVTVNGKSFTGPVVMEDDYKDQEVKIKKTDMTTSDELSGATLEVTDKDGNVIDNWTTDTSVEKEHSIFVKPGTYTLTEKAAPTGYAFATSFNFTVDELGKVTVNGTTLSGPIVMEDAPITQTVKFKKTDISGNELPGATLVVTERTTKNVVDSWISGPVGSNEHSIALAKGEYTLTEKSAPGNYAIATSIDFDIDNTGKITAKGVTLVGNNDTIVMVDDYKKADVKIKKTDIAGKELAGATLEVTNSATGKLVTSWVSGVNGEKEHTISLAPGNYVLKETACPQGYVIATAIAFSVDTSGNVLVKNKTVTGNTIVMEDGYADQEVKIKKTDIGQTKELSGAKLQVTDRDGNIIDSWETDVTKETEHTITVKPGTYTLTETAAPQGYVIATAFQFTVNERGVVTVNGKTVSGPVVMEDDYADQKVQIKKTDIGQTKELDGATLEVTDASGNVVETWTTDTTKEKAHTITVKPGTYTLTEKAAPQGYAIATAFNFTVDELGVVTVNGKTVTGPVVMEDDYAKTTVKIKKTDMAGKELPGATLEVTEKATGNLIESWKSGVNGETEHSIALKTGRYVLTEKAAPLGYAIATAIDFMVDLNGNVKVNGIVETGPIVMADNVALMDVRIKKTDMAGAELAGATLEVKDQATGKLMTSWISGQNGEKEHKVSLVAGRYVLSEKAAPNGYAIATDIDFTVDNFGKVTVNGKTVSGPIVMEDDYAEQTVKIKKTDIGQTKELDNAKLEVTDSNGNVVDSWTTNTSVELEHAISVKPGTYKLTETAAPNGYVIATEFLFTVDSTGKVTGQSAPATTVSGKTTVSGNLIVMEDDYTEWPVQIKKTDMAGNELPGATLQVEDIYGNFVDSWVSGPAGSNAHTINVKPGTYVLTETAAPTNYAISTAIKFTVDEFGAVTVDGKTVTGALVMEDDYYKKEVKFKKTDVAGNELAGATLEVVDQTTGDKVASWISGQNNETEHSLFLKVGKYTLIEKAAPLGYAIATAIDFKVDGNGTITATGNALSGTNNDIIVMEDDYVIADVKIKKTDMAGKELPGASLKVTEQATGKIVTSWISGQKGEKEHTISLKYGNYILEETAAPNGYAIATQIDFSVDGNGKVVVNGKTVYGPIVMEDDYKPHDVYIKKTDIGKTKALDGAKLVVTNAAGGVEDSWTTDTTKETEHLIQVKPGTYTLTETAAPNGYEIATAFKFTVNMRGVVTVDGKTVTGPVVMEDDYSDRKVQIKKTDIGQTQELTNARFEVTDQGGNVVDSWTTDASLEKEHIIDVKPGSYTLTEKAAPQGYDIATAFDFTVDFNGNVTGKSAPAVTVSGKTTASGDLIVMEDALTFRDVKIKKTDIGQTKELSGATLEVTDKNGKVVDRWTTNTAVEKEHTIRVQAGTYTLTEKAAPQGFVIATAFDFTVDLAGNVTVNGKKVTGPVVMEDDYAIQTVKIKKTDIGQTKELSGATLSVTDKNGKVVDRWTTDTTVEKEHIIYVKPGTYTLTEQAAPLGFLIATAFQFTVDELGKVTVNGKTVSGPVVMEDDYVKKTFTILLTNKNKKRLAGGKLIIKDANGGPVYEWKNNGKPKKVSLKPGKYTLTQPTAPDGYNTADDIPFEVVLNTDGTTTLIWDGKETDKIVMVDDQGSDKTSDKKATSVTSAKTGDNNHLMSWMLLGMLALAAMLGLLAARKRRV